VTAGDKKAHKVQEKWNAWEEKKFFGALKVGFTWPDPILSIAGPLLPHLTPCLIPTPVAPGCLLPFSF